MAKSESKDKGRQTTVSSSQNLQPSEIPEALNLAVQHFKAGNLSQAKDVFNRILKTDPREENALHLLGVVYFKEGDNEKAVELITEALDSNNQFPAAHSNLGAVYKAMGHLDDAAACYRKAIECQTDFAETHFNLGNVLKDMNHSAKAVTSFQKAIALNPDFADAHNNLGVLLHNLGQFDDAIESHRKVLALNPGSANAHYNLGRTLNKLGRTDEALASFRSALDIDPSLHEVSHFISSIIGKTTDIAPEKYVRELFDEYARTFDDHLTNRLDYETPSLIRKTVDDVADIPKTFPRVLDLGCGTGMVAENFRDKASKIDGVDLSPKMLEIAEAKGVYANLYLSDVLEFLEGPDARSVGYDLIVSSDTFVYIGKLDGIFAAIRKALADAGLFAFSVEYLIDGDFKLLPTSRYSQSDAYIDKLAAEFGFSVLCRNPVTLRIENEIPIQGRIFVLQATG